MAKGTDPRYAPHYAITLRLKPSVGQLLEDISRQMGITKTAAVSVALRQLAQRENIPVPTEEGAES
jgi:antitoxin component of RelBE/YafQ-DinJ toxin-antitoxin module